MNNHTKLLVIFSFLIIVSGLGLLWFGSKQTSQIPPILKPTPYMTNTTESIASESAVESEFLGIEGESFLVSKVIDGDTIKLSSGQTVRLIGIDTPETKDPRKSVQCFGKEASAKTKELLEGKMVVLQRDISEFDKYHRILRYVFLPLEDGNLLFINDYLIREGFAKVLTYPPDVKYNEDLREAEKQAREENRGLWGRC